MREVARRFGLGELRPAGELGGGWQNVALRLDSDAGPLVLRTFPDEMSPDALRWQHELVLGLKPSVPEVVAPLEGREGETFFVYEGRLAALYPFVRGRAARRCDGLAREAGALLARVHQAALRLDLGRRPGNPAWRELDGLWDGEAVSSWLEGSAPARWSRKRELLGAELDAASSVVQELDLREGPVHGDFYAANLIVRRRRIAGLVDWDEARVDWLALDVAYGCWELAKDKRTHRLRRDRAREFLAGYRAAGASLSAAEADALVPLMRFVRLKEVLAALTQAARGGDWDEPYAVHNWSALRNLRDEPPLDAPARTRGQRAQPPYETHGGPASLRQ